MITRIAFTLVPVRDMARARRFYEEDLGLRCTVDFRGEWIEYDLAGGCFAITTMVPELTPRADAGGIAFEVDDVDAAVKALRAKGHRVKVEPFSTPVCHMAIVLDPDGNAITLHHVTE